MEDTITISSEIQDLREISFKEGFMSKIAMDYCMMAMFFKVKNVYPIHTHCFNIWNCSLSYYSLKKDMQENYTYTDCDIIEDQATNKDFTFIIPYFQNSHYISIVRRWIDNKIYFLYNDSLYKTERTLIKTSSTHIPYEVFAFLMNSPLWPEGETVHWIRVPSVTQEEDECGFRTLLHTYLLVMSEYPIYSLILLNYIRNKKLKSNHAFYKYAEKKLTTLCRQWIKDIMYSKRWKTTDWIKDVLAYKTDSYSSKIKDGNCLIMKCTAQYKEEVINIVREERNAEAAKVEAEKAKQRKLQKSVMIQVETEQIEPGTEEHSEEQKSVMTQVETEQIEPTIEEHTEKQKSVMTQVETEQIEPAIEEHTEEQFDTATTDRSADKELRVAMNMLVIAVKIPMKIVLVQL
jgi:hypothetical protein